RPVTRRSEGAKNEGTELEEELVGGARSDSNRGHDNNDRQPWGAGGRSGAPAAIPLMERRCRPIANLSTESTVQTLRRSKGRCVQPPDAENRTSGGVGG